MFWWSCDSHSSHIGNVNFGPFNQFSWTKSKLRQIPVKLVEIRNSETKYTEQLNFFLNYFWGLFSSEIFIHFGSWWKIASEHVPNI